MKIVEINKDNFDSKVLKSEIPVLVGFNATWCGPCKMLRPVLDEIADTRSNFKIVSVDVDENSDLAKEYGVMSIPCLVAIKDGKEVNRSVGFRPKEDIESMMEEL